MCACVCGKLIERERERERERKRTRGRKKEKKKTRERERKKKFWANLDLVSRLEQKSGSIDFLLRTDEELLPDDRLVEIE